MAANRIRRFMSTDRPVAPLANVSTAIPHGFVLCPPQLVTANTWQQAIYRLAYEQAQAAVRIPRHHRVLFSVWN